MHYPEFTLETFKLPLDKLSCLSIVAPIRWEIMDEITCAEHDEPAPPKCSPTKVFIPIK